MINHNKLDLDQFFYNAPFSSSQKRIYDSALDGIDFFNELYIKSNKTYFWFLWLKFTTFYILFSGSCS